MARSFEPTMTPDEIAAWVTLAQDGTLSQHAGATNCKADVEWLIVLNRRVDMLRHSRKQESTIGVL